MELYLYSKYKKIMLILILCLALSSQTSLNIKKEKYDKKEIMNDINANKHIPFNQILKQIIEKELSISSRGILKFVYYSINKSITDFNTQTNEITKKINSNLELKEFLDKVFEENKESKILDNSILEQYNEFLEQLEKSSLDKGKNDLSSKFNVQLKELSNTAKDEVKKLKIEFDKLDLIGNSKNILTVDEQEQVKNYIKTEVTLLLKQIDKKSEGVVSYTINCIKEVCSLSFMKPKTRLSTLRKKKNIFKSAFFSLVVSIFLVYALLNVFFKVIFTSAGRFLSSILWNWSDIKLQSS